MGWQTHIETKKDTPMGVSFLFSEIDQLKLH